MSSPPPSNNTSSFPVLGSLQLSATLAPSAAQPRHRRSKAPEEDRLHVCPQCGKSYLSYPALYTHNKLKHNSSSSNLKRGSAAKKPRDADKEKLKFNPSNFSYFKKEGREGVTEVSALESICQKVFDEVFGDEILTQKKGIKHFDGINSYIFFSKFLADEHCKELKLENTSAPTDQVLIFYLNSLLSLTCPAYFHRVLKFVVLFREFVNKTHRSSFSDSEYTEIKDAEDVPDKSNDFIIEFLTPEKEGENFGFSKEESVDLTQNLCQWMYDNNFTASKLTLIHPNDDSNF